MVEAVQVAGGLVVRRSGTRVEVLLIDDRFGYVTLPKGHVEPGEILEQAAVREIAEETGINCRLLAPIAKVSYTFRDQALGKTIAKEAYYFLAEALGGNMQAQEEEVTSVRFVDLADAERLAHEQGYANNMDVFTRGLAMAQSWADRVEPDLTGVIDHTVLRPDATPADVERLCKEAIAFRFASVCVHPSYVLQCANELRGTGVDVCTVIGFPHGATTSETKAYEAREAVQNGARELDMVAAVGRICAGDYEYVEQDIRAVVQAVGPDAVVKVILETSLLTSEQQIMAAQAAERAGAHYVKTSTGFAGGGATVDAVRTLRDSVGSSVSVKASGGIRSRSDALAMTAAGASRIGASAGVKLLAYSQTMPWWD